MPLGRSIRSGMCISRERLLTTGRLHGKIIRIETVARDMPLDNNAIALIDGLEITGPVRALESHERDCANAPISIKTIRDSHHAVARLMARGLSNVQISLQTGYSLSRLSILKRDPTFAQLVEEYRRDDAVVAQEFEAMSSAIARDAMQVFHERILDMPEAISTFELLEGIKIHADRGGHAPINRSINKNLNLNVGDRLDAVKRQRKDAA